MDTDMARGTTGFQSLLLGIAVAILGMANGWAVPIAFDLRDTGAKAQIVSGTVHQGTITATLVPLVEGGSGDLNQTQDGFGINAVGSKDNTHNLDGAEGTESIIITFNTDIVFKQLKLSAFGDTDLGRIRIGTFSPLPLNSTGVTSFSNNSLVPIGQSVLVEFVAGNGFSFDSFTVELVPGSSDTSVPDSLPSSFVAAMFLGFLAFVRPRRAPRMIC